MSKRWSKLQREIYNLIDDSINITCVFAVISDKVASKLVSTISGRSFTSKMTKNYFKNTKLLKSAFGIGKGGKTAQRVWIKESFITTFTNKFLNDVFGGII